MSKDNKHKRSEKTSPKQEEALTAENQPAEKQPDLVVTAEAAPETEPKPADPAEQGPVVAEQQDNPADSNKPAGEERVTYNEKPQQVTAKPASGGKGLSALALIVAVASAGFSGWVWNQNQHAQASVAAAVKAPDHTAELQQQGQQLQQLVQQTGSYKDEITRLENRVNTLPSAADLGENQRLLVQLQSAQQAFTQRFEQAFGNTRQDWRLAEAEHLLRMAHLRLTALQDVSSTRYLLEAADQILYEQDDPAAYAAREALAQALADVRALPKIDRAGVFMRLGALQKGVGTLDQMLPGYTAGESDTGSVDWNKLLDKASSYIRLDINSTEDFKPLLSSQQLTHIRLAISLSLEQAQWAALNGQQAVYDQAVAQAIELLDGYFAADHQAAVSMRTQLQELAGTKISQTMPDINPALVALQGYIQERTLERRAPREAGQ